MKGQTSFLGCRSSSIKRSDEFMKQFQSYPSICTKPMFFPGINIHILKRRKLSLVYMLQHAAKYQMNLSSHLRSTKSMLTPKVWKNAIESLNFIFFSKSEMMSIIPRMQSTILWNIRWIHSSISKFWHYQQENLLFCQNFDLNHSQSNWACFSGKSMNWAWPLT